MDTLQAITDRLSANSFDVSRKLTKEQIEELVHYATLAPSSYNTQNWKFIAITDQATKEQLKALSYNQQKVADAPVVFIILGDLHVAANMEKIVDKMVQTHHLDEPTTQYLKAAPAGAYNNNPGFSRDEAIRSGSLAGMTLMLAAEAKGLVSGPMIGFDPKGVAELLGISERYVPVMMLPVGYDGGKNWPRKPRLPVNEVLSYEKFSE